MVEPHKRMRKHGFEPVTDAPDFDQLVTKTRVMNTLDLALQLVDQRIDSGGRTHVRILPE
ncbi:MAG: hypothetical protein E6I70_01115 [Chloroflexi bacterium]|nr:MAG: hypothetical protein E6I70_01115 [Chloroflexota bacterium]